MRQRLEISIAYTDKKGERRYANRLGNLWLDTDTMKGTIDLPPGVSIHAVEGAYINVQPPFEKEGEPRQQQRGSSRQMDQRGARRTGGYEGGGGDDSDIPF